MSDSFTPMNVTRFLLRCLLALGIVFGLFQLLTHMTAHKSITPSASHSLVEPASPMPPPDQPVLS